MKSWNNFAARGKSRHQQESIDKHRRSVQLIVLSNCADSTAESQETGCLCISIEALAEKRQIKLIVSINSGKYDGAPTAFLKLIVYVLSMIPKNSIPT